MTSSIHPNELSQVQAPVKLAAAPAESYWYRCRLCLLETPTPACQEKQ
jgi:hypothetical protein